MTKGIRPPPAPPADPAHARWTFFHDVLMLQFKLFLAAWQHFILGPATIVAAFLDLILKSDRHGSRFYRVLDWGRRCEDALGLYAALHRDDGPGGKAAPAGADMTNLPPVAVSLSTDG